MYEPKLAAPRVDTDRAVRELLNAFNLLKTKHASHTIFSPRKERRPLQPQEDRATAFKEAVQFMLHQIREASKPEELQATVPPEPLYVANENIEPSVPGINEMAKGLRRAAVARLAESDSLRGVDRRSTLRQFGRLVLMAALTWSYIEMMPNWWHHLSLKLALSALSSVGASLDKMGDSGVLLSGEILFVASVAIGIYLRWRRFRTHCSRRI